MVKIIDVDNKVWKRKRALDKEVEELLTQMAGWQVNKTKQIQFEKPQKSLKGILEKEFAGKRQVQARKLNKDPKIWLVMLKKRSRKSGDKAPQKHALNGVS